ncbi:MULTISPECIES: helix-turn-helix domain-containing protein [unclassified Streptomyces]|uniref:helix-turn-helix domain-containing protein n=1 Tax=unclassified Streptomyces TaxID=2593676 RepID=UPI003396A76C
MTLVADVFFTRASSAEVTTTELLDHAVTMRQLAQHAIAALVVRQRSRGAPLGDLAPKLGLSSDRLRKKYPPDTVDQELASRARPTRAGLGLPQLTDPAATKPSLLRHPHQRLACALTRMWEGSGVTQRALAEYINVDRSFVSRMLSGERRPNLRCVKMIAAKCGGDADLVVLLWTIATGEEIHTTDPVTTLRRYLRALRYAAGDPSDKQILLTARHAITASELQQAVTGPGVPDWLVIHQITTALQSLPEAARPLWTSAVQHAAISNLSADAFG